MQRTFARFSAEDVPECQFGVKGPGATGLIEHEVGGGEIIGVNGSRTGLTLKWVGGVSQRQGLINESKRGTVALYHILYTSQDQSRMMVHVPT
jgi:hypothetical protein